MMIGTAALACMALVAGQDQTTEAPSPPSQFSYSYVSVSYVTIDVDGIDDDLQGFGVGASFDLNDNIFAQVSYQAGSVDISGVDVDLNVLAFGGGYHHPLSEEADLSLSASVLSAEAEALGASDEETGFAVRAGLRVQVSDLAELRGGIGVVDITESETVFDIGAVVGLTGALCATVGAEFSEDETSLAAGLRYYF